MSDVSKTIDRLLQEYVNDLLKAAGFKRQRRRYSRVLSDRLELLTVEASTFNSSESGRFTVGLAIVLPDLARRLRGFEVDLSKAKGFEGGIRTCLGFLDADRRQDRWQVQVGSDNAEEGLRLREAIETLALPWFENARTEKGLLEILEQDVSMDALLVRAILYSSKGDYEGTKAMLSEVVQRNSELAAWTVQWAKDRNLLASELH
jgi:hypothetical protein